MNKFYESTLSKVVGHNESLDKAVRQNLECLVMENDWGEYKLDEIAILRNGAGIKQQFFSESSIAIPLVKVSNFTSNSVDISGLTKVDHEHAKKWESHILGVEDIVVATVGSWPPNWSSVVGKVVRIPQIAAGAIQNQNTCSIHPKDNIDKDFLYYVLKTGSFINYVINIAQGSASQARVPVKKLGEFKFKAPLNIEKQRMLAKTLVDLDKKIELNKQTNQTLEKMAQALFKSWFVDFDPVFDNLLATVDFKLEALPNDFPEALLNRAEKRLLALDDNAKAALLSATLSSKTVSSKNKSSENKSSENRASTNIHQHFPNEFEHNEQLGWIPKGWTLKSIDELCDINPQSWTKKNAPEVVKYVDLANAKNGTVGEVVEYNFSEAPSRARRVLQPHDIIIGVVRPANRSFAYVNEEGLTGSTGFAVVRPINTNHRAFSYLSLTNDDCIQEFTRIADGAAYPAIKPEDVAKTSCIFSNDIILEKFEQLVGEFMNKIAANERQLVPLTKLRDTLLPKIISGELQIPDALETTENSTASIGTSVRQQQ